MEPKYEDIASEFEFPQLLAPIIWLLIVPPACAAGMEGSSIEMANNAETKTAAILFITIDPLLYSNVMAFFRASACSLSFNRHSRPAVQHKRYTREKRLFSVKIKLKGILCMYVNRIHGITKKRK